MPFLNVSKFLFECVCPRTGLPAHTNKTGGRSSLPFLNVCVQVPLSSSKFLYFPKGETGVMLGPGCYRTSPLTLQYGAAVGTEETRS